MDKKIKFTPEQLTELQSFFQQSDFTANMTLNREYDFSGEKSEVFVRAKEFSENIGSGICVHSV